MGLYHTLEELVLYLLNTPFFVPQELKKNAKGSEDVVHVYKLSHISRFFLLFENYSLSILGLFVGVFVQGTVLVGTAVAIRATIVSARVPVDSCRNPICDHSALCPDSTICEPIDDPTFSELQFWVFVILLIDYCIRLSCVAFVPPRLSHTLPTDFDSMELYMRDATPEYQPKSDPVVPPWTRVRKYCLRPTVLIDLVSILPNVIEYALHSSNHDSSVIRILRITRVARIIKLSRSGGDVTVNLMFQTLGAAAQSLIAFSFCGVILVILFGSILFAFERGNYMITSSDTGEVTIGYQVPSIDGTGFEISAFRSILDCMYFAAITLSTVGYGDLYPRTAEGRILASFLGLIGSLMLALPVTVIGHYFGRDFVAYSQEQEKKILRKTIAELEKKANIMKSKMKPATQTSSVNSDIQDPIEVLERPSMDMIESSEDGDRGYNEIAKDDEDVQEDKDLTMGLKSVQSSPHYPRSPSSRQLVRSEMSEDELLDTAKARLQTLKAEASSLSTLPRSHTINDDLLITARTRLLELDIEQKQERELKHFETDSSKLPSNCEANLVNLLSAVRNRSVSSAEMGRTSSAEALHKLTKRYTKASADGSRSVSSTRPPSRPTRGVSRSTSRDEVEMDEYSDDSRSTASDFSATFGRAISDSSDQGMSSLLHAILDGCEEIERDMKNQKKLIQLISKGAKHALKTLASTSSSVPTNSVPFSKTSSESSRVRPSSHTPINPRYGLSKQNVSFELQLPKGLSVSPSDGSTAQVPLLEVPHRPLRDGAATPPLPETEGGVHHVHMQLLPDGIAASDHHDVHQHHQHHHHYHTPHHHAVAGHSHPGHLHPSHPPHAHVSHTGHGDGLHHVGKDSGAPSAMRRPVLRTLATIMSNSDMHEEIEREDALGSDADTSSQRAKAGAKAGATAGLPLRDTQTSPASELPADADEDFAPASAIVVSREGEMSLWNSSFSEMPETYEV